MASQKREQDTPLAERLLKEFHRFSFFQAVLLLESFGPGKAPLGAALAPEDEGLSFHVEPGFVFPPSELAGLRREEGGGRAEVEVSFLGLIGPSGVLPHWYNELALERCAHGDRSLVSFLDIFHHRLISLFYLAWKKHRWPVRYLPGARDLLSGAVLSLMGLGTPALSGRLRLEEEALIYFAGLFSRSVPSAVAIEAAIAHYAGTDAAVEQFLERLIPIDDQDLTRLGRANSRLGTDAVCGGSAWESQGSFRVRLGPMGYRSFLRFLPDGKLLRPIASLVRYMAGAEYEFELRVILKRDEVPLCTLGEPRATAPRLGWSTWLRSPPFLHPEDPSVSFQEKEL